MSCGHLLEGAQPASQIQPPPQCWKEHQQLWPILVSLASKYLCAPPSSVAYERLFSTAGDISTETQNRLFPEKLEQLLFLNKNLCLLNFEY